MKGIIADAMSKSEETNMEEDILSLTDILFKVSGLVNGSGEAVNKVVLIKNLIQLQQASVCKL